MPVAAEEVYLTLIFLSFDKLKSNRDLGKANESFHVEFLLKSLSSEVQKYIMSTSAFKEKPGTFGARIGSMLDENWPVVSLFNRGKFVAD